MHFKEAVVFWGLSALFYYSLQEYHIIHVDLARAVTRSIRMTQIERSGWLPEQLRLSHVARSGLAAVSCKKNFPESHIINPLLTKFVPSRWLDTFFARLCTSTSSRSIKTQKKNLTSIQLFWPHTLSITHIYFISLVLYKHLNHILFHRNFLLSNDSSWCAALNSDLRSQYLQVDLRKIHAVSAVSTQGAFVRSFYDALLTQYSWVSSYLVHYSLDGNEWIVLTDKGGEIKVCFSTVHIL